MTPVFHVPVATARRSATRRAAVFTAAVAAAFMVPIALSVTAIPGLAIESARAQTADHLANQALAVLKTHCSRCHGGPQVASGEGDEGGFDHVLDLARLIEKRLIVPGKPDGSELLHLVEAGDMPPAEAPTRPSAEDIAALRQWISRGAPLPGAMREPDRAFVSPADLERVIASDLRSQLATRRPHLRYITLAHLHNAGSSAEELAIVHQGLYKLLASLSWKPQLHIPRGVGSQGLILRVDLRALGWSRAIWDWIIERDPYAVIHDSADSRYIRRATRATVAQVRADWLISAAAAPPLYHEILDIPTQLGELERRLGLDVARDVQRHRAMRAGFNGSGVSQHNRVIERHDLGHDRYYWQSFDFRSSAGERNIFAVPLEFRPDGGEIIFSLPNGFQGYMIVDERGRRIDKAPTEVVADPRRPDRAVTNGISCMGCHDRGIIPKKDEIRDHVLANRRAFERRSVPATRDILALYPPGDRLRAMFARDRKRFARAMKRAGITGKVEPINASARMFEAELDLVRAAAELGLPPEALRRRLQRAPASRSDLQRELGALLVPGGTIARDAFVELFPTAARRIGVGTPRSRLSTAHRLAVSCDTGSGRDCLQAGLAYYRGVGVRRDPARARRLLRAACQRDQSEGCRFSGHLYYRGHGVARNRARASQLYRRACKLGSAQACAHAGFLFSGGRGIAADPFQAAQHYVLACQLGDGPSCRAVSLQLETGQGVRQDRKRAIHYADLACQHGVIRSCTRLAHRYRWGRGVTIDWLRSYRYFKRACDLGDKDACAQVLDLAKLLDLR